MTVLIYLSECEGGATRFEGDVAFAPRSGALLVHVHGEDRCLEHEADPVDGGTKYVLRTDLVYSSGVRSHRHCMKAVRAECDERAAFETDSMRSARISEFRRQAFDETCSFTREKVALSVLDGFSKHASVQQPPLKEWPGKTKEVAQSTIQPVAKARATKIQTKTAKVRGVSTIGIHRHAA